MENLPWMDSRRKMKMFKTKETKMQMNKKKEYVQPKLKVIKLKQRASLLSGSGDPDVITPCFGSQCSQD